MTVLKARVGGQWVEVSGGGGGGGTNEVTIGPDAPTDTTELWYDTDATGYTPDDLRWQSAWGVVAVMQPLMSQGGQLFGATSMWRADNVSFQAGRRYKITVNVRAYTGGTFRITTGGANTVPISPNPDTYAVDGNSTYDCISYCWLHTPSVTATQTLVFDLVPFVGNPQVYGELGWIEDVGPVPGSPVYTPSQVTPWTAFPFATGWSNLGGFQACQYRKAGDEVQVRGVAGVGAGAGIVIGTLPVGFRPPANLILSANQGEPNSVVRLNVYTDGGMFLQAVPSSWATISAQFSVST